MILNFALFKKYIVKVFLDYSFYELHFKLPYSLMSYIQA